MPKGISNLPTHSHSMDDDLAGRNNGSSGGRIAVWRITYDKETGLNPVIEVV